LTQGIFEGSQAKTRLDGDDLNAMFGAATALLESNVDAVNALNVFPVPDGDTGTNMFLTLRDVVQAAAPLRGASSADVAAAMARAALMGARGNSGVILSQFFRGISIGLEGTTDFAAEEMAKAYQAAREHAYTAVGEPVEGTILTVISRVAQAAQEALASGSSAQELCEAVCEAARDAVAKTPTMLAVLRDAGVVDAGGQGLSVILEGVRRYVAGEASEAYEIAPPAPVGVDVAGGAVSAGFLADIEDEQYGYCTQFLIEGTTLNVDGIRDRMSAIGRSPVVVGDETMVKVHVHTDEPDPAVDLAASFGTVSQVNVRDMDEQHVEFSAARRQDAGVEPAAVAVVAVASGQGLEELFTSLGASGIIAGGDTMNPSVQDIVDAVELAPSDNVVVLPNNGNIVPAAIQAAELSDKAVEVVPSRFIPQGIAAILSFNPERDLALNRSDMEEALSSVRTGEVTEAVRSATVKGVIAEEGRLIGLLDHELVVSGDSVGDVAVAVIERAGAADGELVTLYWGEPLSEDEAKAVEDKVAGAFPEMEVELVHGGQPHYHLLLSIE
jgi:DAK2 domain fusion protein YloV